jgi:hypothetical protein
MSILHRLPVLALLAAGILFSTSLDARERGPIAPARGAEPPAAPAKESTPEPDRPEEVRVIYYSGDVAVRDTATALPIAFGMLVDSLHSIVVGRGASVQVAVDGRVVVLERPGRFSRAEIIRRAGGEKNEELMAALRLLAEKADVTSSSAVSPARLQAAFAAAIAPSARTAASAPTGMLVPLEPRNTAVTRGPLHFRWLNGASGATYRVVVRDRFDQEVLRHETSDTSFVWESAVLFTGTEYTWSLARVDDSSAAVASTFHRLDDLQGMRLEGGESRIRLALGSENPALPLALGAHFAGLGCYGDAARQFTTAALRTPEHFDRLLRLAREQYASNIGLSAGELEHVQTLGAITMSE